MHAEEANCCYALIVSRFAVLFEVLIMTFHCCGVHVMLNSNTLHFYVYCIMTIMMHTSKLVNNDISVCLFYSVSLQYECIFQCNFCLDMCN